MDKRGLHLHQARHRLGVPRAALGVHLPLPEHLLDFLGSRVWMGLADVGVSLCSNFWGMGRGRGGLGVVG